VHFANYWWLQCACRDCNPSIRAAFSVLKSRHWVFLNPSIKNKPRITHVVRIIGFIAVNPIFSVRSCNPGGILGLRNPQSWIRGLGKRSRIAIPMCHLQILHTHTHTHPFNGPLSGTTRVSRYQKGKSSLDFTEARDSEWQWNLLGHMQVCTSLQTDNHASTSPLSFLQAGCPSCRPTNSVKALKAPSNPSVVVKC